MKDKTKEIKKTVNKKIDKKTVKKKIVKKKIAKKSAKMMTKKKDLILFINYAQPTAVEAVKLYSKQIKRKLKVAVIRDAKNKFKHQPEGIDRLIYCELDRPFKIAKALDPYKDRLLAVVCRGDKNVADFAKIIPFVPYLRTPSEHSLLWSVDKIDMRKHFWVYDRKITPNFLVVSDKSKKTVKEIKKKLKLPVVIKPSGLGASLLVTICFHEEELTTALKRVYRQIKTIYKQNDRREKPKVLVEEFMEGDIYSIDAYVTSRGKISFCPLVSVKTGMEIGFDDFFGYRQMTPTLLKKPSIVKAEKIATKAIKAIGLRSTSVHIELMKTEDGFKVIELGPRLGGFRHEMYQMSYGFNHSLNDLLVRIPKKVFIPKKIKGYSVAMKFFAKKEGKLTKLLGIKKVESLKSFKEIKINKKKGDMCRYAKNGGKSVFNLIMFNKSRSSLLADIRRVEKEVKIETK